MPIIIPNELPAFDTLQEENIFAMSKGKLIAQGAPSKVIKFLGENPGACPWDEAKKYFSKSLMSISSEYTLQI